MDKELKHKYGQNISDQNGKAGNPSVTQNPTNDGTMPEENDKHTKKGTEEENEIQENKSSKEQKNRVIK